MAKCIICGDTGRTSEGYYCNCAIGKVQKRVERSQKMAEKKKAEEREQKKRTKQKTKDNPDKVEQMELLDADEITIDPFYKLYDWVEVTKGGNKGIIGTIIQINKTSKQIVLEAVKHRNGHKVNGKATFTWAHIKPYELPPSEDHLLDLIDLAIDTGDKDWFIELSNRLPK